MAKEFLVDFFNFIRFSRGIAWLVFSIVIVVGIIRESIKDKQKADTADVVDPDQKDPN